ncbi:RmlC-like cupin domain-containing protein [Aspergillus egyptiacus]|nr:RmlC-like cupin domain-containing protein [Aspergillus egyptiacus]
MFLKSTLNSLVALTLALPASAAPYNYATSDSELSTSAKIKLADSYTDRYKILSDDSDFVFDFATTQEQVVTSANFPALTGIGASISMGQLPACSMVFLHLHPRATELFALNSGRVVNEMVPEVGAMTPDGKQRVIRTELHPGMVTVFPAGSFHTQVNPDCEPANFTAAFTSEEFAVGLVAPGLFSFSDGVIERSFGGSIAGEDIEKVRGALPASMAIEVEECLAKCHMAKRH